MYQLYINVHFIPFENIQKNISSMISEEQDFFLRIEKNLQDLSYNMFQNTKKKIDMIWTKVRK